jgi:outer membrane protein OmpA-like peptidoglycan-associated protein
MNYKLATGILVASFFQSMLLGQNETYSIKKAFFSSDIYDEFSPVYYQNDIVFCSNRNLSLLNRSTDQNKGLFKIYFVDTTLDSDWQSARLFSKKLTTSLNDGPVTFNKWRDTIYYSRNLEVNNKLSDVANPRNRLGIFYAVKIDGQWTKVRDLRINNEWYSVTTPWLSPDGKKLYFASDKPGGFGGSDLYYSEWKEERWNDPVNLGPVINTQYNESYPYTNPAGELFFSSDGPQGLGGKDIYFSRFSDSTWLTPVHIDAPINSASDDFGIITDSLMNTGYFSSNRGKTIDIYYFKTNFPQIFYASIQKENQYCFNFSDSGSIVVDTLNLKYEWDFGDGQKTSGEIVNHCFQGPGEYYVKLDIVDKSTKDIFFSKLRFKVELKDFEQPYINSYDIAVKGDSIDFDALKSYLPGYKILSFSWDFGDGTRLQGPRVKHAFEDKGEYMVNLGLVLKSDSTGAIRKTGSSKKIVVVNELSEISTFLAKKTSSRTSYPSINKYPNAIIKSIYSAEKDFKQDAVFQVMLISSKTKINLQGDYFKDVPKNYEVKEVYNKDTEMYEYIVDQQMNLMSTYIAYKAMEKAGYKSVQTIIEVIKDPAEQAVFNLKKIFGTSTDTYFDSYNRLTSSAYLLLDQIIKIMNKYPEVTLEVDVYTDNKGSPNDKLNLSRKYAQVITDYLVGKGMDTRRLVPRGFGSTKPIVSNETDEGRNLNRRIDFVVIR